MSEQELRKYRLTDVEEPTDEQLEALMHAAGEEARRRGAEAEAKFRAELEQLVSDNEIYDCRLSSYRNRL